MILISYDIADDKLRAKFAKYIKRFGHRLQYSVYEIDNGPTFLDSVVADIEGKWKRSFGETDSVMIFKLSKTCKILRFGYAKHDEDDLIVV